LDAERVEEVVVKQKFQIGALGYPAQVPDIVVAKNTG
jgi:hypothetical protein